MFLGVAFYTFVVGSMTSVITESQTIMDNLQAKLKALDDFAEESSLDPEIHTGITNFLSNNYVELFQRIDEEAMIQEL